MVILGNERLCSRAYIHLIRGRRVGLITNHSGVDSRLRATADQLHASGIAQLVALFGPEHGVRGDAADGASVGSGRDPGTGVPVYSLYGETRKPSPQMLQDVEVMLFDIQDVGVRFYTYLYTMSLGMEACAAQGIRFVVLDRPNPLGGERVDGNVLDPEFSSFVGLFPIPIQYGMTIGELAQLFNAEFGLGSQLTVIPMEGWRRSMLWRDTGIPWVAPSPNMPTEDTASVYPGTCFFEGTNVSEGRGTTRPFEQIGAPYVDGPLLAAEMNHMELPGVLFRALYFQPAFSKHQGRTCQGVQLHVVDRDVYQPVRSGFELLAAVRRLWSDDFSWRTTSGDIYNFDALAGTDTTRKRIEAGEDIGAMLRRWDDDRHHFADQRQKALLYS